MFVELDSFSQRRVLLCELKKRLLAPHTVFALSHGFDDGARVDALMDMERNCGDIEGCVFGFPCPLKLWVKVRVIGVGFFSGLPVGFRSYKTDRWVIASVFAPVVVLFDGLLFGFGDFGHSDPTLSNFLLISHAFYFLPV